MTAEAGGILDTRNAIGVPIFDGTDAKWESWRVKVEVRTWQTWEHIWASLQNKHLSSRMMVWTRTVPRPAKTVHALLITKCEGKALSLVSLFFRRFGLEAWRVLKEEYEGNGGNRTAALAKGILDPRTR